MAASVAHPLLNRGGNVRTAVEWNETGIMNHFRHDDHEVGRLLDLRIALVSGGQLRRPESDTALLQTSILRAGGRTAHGGEHGVAPGQPFRCHGAPLSVWRIGDERSSGIPFSGDAPL